jgi:hypothetical protein
MSDAIQQIVENCPSCAQPIDVTEQAPFSEVACPSCGATMRARVHFNNFTLLQLLGEGGMGSVFKALDNNLQRRVALKILKRSAGSTEEDWAKLATEARATAAINHQNVVKVFSFGEDHGQFYLAMELVEKGSLDGLMVLQTRVAEAQVLDIGIQIAEGLQAAFEGNLIHRDIKPGNILFANSKLAKIVDFGLARVLSEEAQEAGEIWGTPFYVAPEKLDGRPEDFRSDIYSLGATLFHALAGRPPFDAKTASMVVLKHIKSQVVSLQAFAPNVSDETAYVINRMMNKEPQDRYGSYEELLTHLQYARQRLQKRNAERKGGKARPAAKAGSNRLVLASLWSVAAIACVAIVMGVLGLQRSEAAHTLKRDPLVSTVAPLMEQGREALNASHFEAARTKFEAALKAADGHQPARNWALAQIGLASVLLGDKVRADETFKTLEGEAFFDAAPESQALGRFFDGLAREMNGTPPVSAWLGENYEAFGLLAGGIKNWKDGDAPGAQAMIEQFLKSHPTTPDDWLSGLKPLAESCLAESRH